MNNLQDLINRMQAMGRVGADAYCEFEGKLMLSTNGINVVYIKDGYKRPVTNPVIRNCLIGRAGTGAPFQVERSVWDKYTLGENAFARIQSKCASYEAMASPKYGEYSPTAPASTPLVSARQAARIQRLIVRSQ